MTAPDILAGRLRLLADRLYADGTFGGKIVAEELLEAADLLMLAPSAPDEVDEYDPVIEVEIEWTPDEVDEVQHD